jgi:hypothetical protein
MRKLNLLTASSVIALGLAIGSPAFAATITIQGDTDLQTLCTTNCSGSGTGTATYTSPNVVLNTGGTASGDTAQISVPNGYVATVGTVALGTLDSMLGGADGTSFDMSNGFNAGGQNAYWVLTLADGTVINSFSDNVNGANGFDVNGGTATSSCSGTSCAGHSFGESWATFAADNSTVAAEDLLSIMVEVGGQGVDYSQSIDSITLQGVPATPIPTTIALFAGGLGIFGFLARRRKQNAQATA